MLVQALKDQGVDTVFGYPGGAVLPIYDEIFQQNDIRHVLVRHEQGAVHAAEGYARSTGKPGVVLVTSGPAATNAVTGLTGRAARSIPIVCFTGQVPTFMIGTDGFQEADTVGITRPCTKHNWLVKDRQAVRDHPPGLPRRHHRPPRPGARRHPQGRPVRDRHLYAARQGAHRPLQAGDEGRRGPDHPAGRADGKRRTAALLHRRRGGQLGPRRQPASCASLVDATGFRSPRR
ncbi:MAG: thiamine pyrophosphate-binding protein [Paracoccaceae bacterium]